MSTIRLRVQAYMEIAAGAGHKTMAEQALAAGLGIGTIHRLRNGAAAGPRVITALLQAYGTGFDDLFEVGAPAAGTDSRVKAAA